MAMDMKAAVQMVINCLAQTLSGDTAAIRDGEDKLAKLQQAPGFGVVVGQVLINGEAPFPFRHLAGVLLRQYVDKKWEVDDDDEEAGPPLSDEEKTAIRNLLPALLSDANSKIRTASSMVIASIARTDFPHAWPGLLENLVGAMNSGNPTLIQGVLRCLVLMAEEITDEPLVESVPHIFPILLKVFAAGTFSVRAQIRCLTVYRILCESMNTVSGSSEFSKVIEKLLLPTLPNFLEIMAQILRHRSSGQATSDDTLAGEGNTSTGYGLRLEAIRALTTLLTHFRPIFKQEHMRVFLEPLWQAMVASYPLYIRDFINTEEEESKAFDSDGDAIGLSSFMIVCFEFFKELASISTVRPLLTPMLPELADLALGYCQLTANDVEAATEDPNQWAEDEDDLLQKYTVRGAGLELLNGLDDQFGLPAVMAIAKSVQKRLVEAAAGGASAWKIREAAVYALGNCTEEFFDGRIEFDMEGFVKNVLVPDLDAANANPLLRCRAVWSVSRLSRIFVASGQQKLVEFLLMGSVRCLGRDQPLPVRIAASRAIGVMCCSLDKVVMSPAMPIALEGFGELLSMAKGDTLLATLESLSFGLSVNHDATKAVVGKLLPLLIGAWQHSGGKNRLVTELSIDIFETLLKIPGLLEPVSQTLFPVIFTPISQPDEYASGVVEAALDIYRHILVTYESGGVPFPEIFMTQGMPLVMKLLLTSDDHSAVASAAMVLTAFVRHAGKIIGPLKIGSPPISALDLLAKCVQRLLHPQQVDIVSCHGPPLVTQILWKLSDSLSADAVAGIVRLVVQRLHSSQLPTAVESFIMLFARLVHSSGAELLNLLQRVGDCTVIAKVPLPMKAATKKHKYPRQEYKEEETKVNALQFVLQKWCTWQPDVPSPYPTKVTIMALCKLLQLKDIRLMQITTDGYPVVDATAGRSSRSKPATLRYNSIPVAAKMVSLLVNRWQEVGANEIVKAAAKAKEIEKKNGAAAFAPGSAEHKAIAVAAEAQVRRSKKSSFADADDFSAYLEDEFEGNADQYKLLSDFADDQGSGLDDDDIEEEEKDAYPEREADPLWQLDELSTLSQFFIGWAQADMSSLKACVDALSAADQKLLEKLLNNSAKKA